MKDINKRELKQKKFTSIMISINILQFSGLGKP